VVAATTFITSLRILLSDLNPSHLQHNPNSRTDSDFGLFFGSREISVMFKDLVPPAGHDDSAASSAPSLSLLRHCGILSRCRSDRNLCSVSAAVFKHPYGFLGLYKMYPHVFTHSSRGLLRGKGHLACGSPPSRFPQRRRGKSGRAPHRWG